MLDQAWAMSPSVALRPEPFGALAYHFGNRKLTFLKRPELVTVVCSLAGAPTVRDALTAAGIPAANHEAYAGALAELAASDMIRPRPTDLQTTELQTTELQPTELQPTELQPTELQPTKLQPTEPQPAGEASGDPST